MLHLLHESEAALPGDFQFHQDVFARGVTQHRVDVAPGNLQRLRFVFGAVNNRRAPRPVALSFRTAERPVAVRRSAVSLTCLAMFES